MALVPPRFIPPNHSAPSYYAIWIEDELSSEQYGTSTYETEEEAQAICEALQEAYGRFFHDCTFSPQLRAKPAEDLFAFDSRLISITYR